MKPSKRFLRKMNQPQIFDIDLKENNVQIFDAPLRAVEVKVGFVVPHSSNDSTETPIEK